MPRQGDDFHRLVEHLERAVSGQEGVTIESPKYLPDKITGELREHDIVLTYHSPLRQLVVAIECRDRSRRVAVGQVEEFHTKCRDTGVNKGIIVASRGFGRPARMKATHYGIDCLTLAQVGQVDWCAQSKIVNTPQRPQARALGNQAASFSSGQNLETHFQESEWRSRRDRRSWSARQSCELGLASGPRSR